MTIVIENVKAAELPAEWAARLNAPEDARFNVRIEEVAEPVEDTATQEPTSMPAFGMWRDRDDTAEVERHLRALRAPRTGSRNEQT
jgi:hypothetical protein